MIGFGFGIGIRQWRLESRIRIPSLHISDSIKHGIGSLLKAESLEELQVQYNGQLP